MMMMMMMMLCRTKQQLANKLPERVRRKQLPQHVVIKELRLPPVLRMTDGPRFLPGSREQHSSVTNCRRDASEFRVL